MTHTQKQVDNVESADRDTNILSTADAAYVQLMAELRSDMRVLKWAYALGMAFGVIGWLALVTA
ncbi:hypothetical protein GQ649_03955 [Rhodococcus sp. DSM 6344]|nr:hypothetical protein [Rhodococcus erythropolis]